VPDLLAVPRAVEGPVHRLAGETMGTTWSVTFVVPHAIDLTDLRRAIEHELDTVDAQMSTWRDDSDLTRLNRAPAGQEVELPGPLFSVLRFALAVARDSNGAYDPTLGPLVDLWGFGPPGRRVAPPHAAAIAEARARVGWQRLDLDETRRRARQTGGVSVDLSAVAKGYAVDAVAGGLERLGVVSFLVDVGGELRGRGVKPGGQPWWVRLQPPDGITAGDTVVETVVALHDRSIATSGDYLRYFDHDGRRYAHTIDPRTGWPVAGRAASVSVLHESCMAADAFSTALTVMDAEDALAFCRTRGLAAVIASREPEGLVERMTPAFAAMLE
jgi:FAD:protein FMN transferase